MALKEPFMVKTVEGDNVLTLKPDPGEAYLVKDVQLLNPATNYATLQTERNTVGYFRVGGPLGNQLPFTFGFQFFSPDMEAGTTLHDVAAGDDSFPFVNSKGEEIKPHILLAESGVRYPRAFPYTHGPRIQKTLLGLLMDLGIFKGYPVSEGEEFTITGAAQDGAIQVVVYEVHDAADINPEMENGSMSKTYLFINYGDAGESIIEKETLLTRSVSPPEFPAFPFGEGVPPKKVIDVHGILASDYTPSGGLTEYSKTWYLRFVKERKTLWDPDKNGLPMIATSVGAIPYPERFGEGYSLAGNYSEIDARYPFFLVKPLHNVPGDEIQVIWVLYKAGAGSNIPVEKHQIGLIEKVTIGEEAAPPPPKALPVGIPIKR